MSDPFLVSLFQHKAWCNERLVEALRAALDNVDRGQMAVMLLTLDHTSIVDRIFRAHLSGTAPDFPADFPGDEEAATEPTTAAIATEAWQAEAWKPPTTRVDVAPSPAPVVATLRETDAWYLGYVERATPADLDTVVMFAFVGDGDTGRMTKGQMLAHIVTHGASHRGAIGKMLESAGVAGAPDMVTTFAGQTFGR